MINDFYHILSDNHSDSECNFEICLNSEHPIYAAHFPGNPITPGVMLIEIVNALIDRRTGHNYTLLEAKSIKYLNIISPIENPVINFTIILTPDNDLMRVECKVWRGDTVFTRISSKYKREFQPES